MNSLKLLLLPMNYYAEQEQSRYDQKLALDMATCSSMRNFPSAPAAQ
jgi:aconitase A